MDTLQSHFHQWGAVAIFVVFYGSALLFAPFYRKMDKKPATAYLAFVLAFAIEMHGIPLSMYWIASVMGRTLPEGILWGHTFVQYIGHAGMYLQIVFSVVALVLIVNGWYNIYHRYWSKERGDGRIVRTGVYRYIRHPQYTGFLLLTAGMILGWATLPTLVMWPFVCYLYYRLARKEEKDMIEEFGEEYVSYRQTTKMFIPGVF